MKEIRYLVFFDGYGFYAQKQSKDTEDWTFTKKIRESKKHKTIHGAFIRLDYAKNNPEFENVNKGILVQQVETVGNKEITKLIAKMSYKTMDKPISEKVIEQPEVAIEPTVTETESETNNGIKVETKDSSEPIAKKRRGRPPGSKNKPKTEEPKEETPKFDMDEKTFMENAEPVEEPKENLTNIVEEESHVKVAKISTEDSFWD